MYKRQVICHITQCTVAAAASSCSDSLLFVKNLQRVHAASNLRLVVLHELACMLSRLLLLFLSLSLFPPRPYITFSLPVARSLRKLKVALAFTAAASLLLLALLLLLLLFSLFQTAAAAKAAASNCIELLM